MEHKRVLVIDDEVHVATLFAEALRHRGHSVSLAHTGEDGLRVVQTERPDAVLLDITMPDRNGLDVLDDITAVDRTIPVIMVTATVDDAICREALRRGAYSWLSKPVDLPVLERLVDLAMGRKRHWAIS